jgi:uncharacterized protein (UPF0276 family)
MSSRTREQVNGVGIGLRFAMARRTLQADVPEIRWLEIHPENYVERGGRFRHLLESAVERFPLVTHGLTGGFGAVEPLDEGYARALRAFLHQYGVPWHSEHLCFSSADGVMLHDLMPLPFTLEAAKASALRIRELRDRLELPVALENVSYYARAGVGQAAGTGQWTELEFVNEVLERADAKLLLDVNNVFVNGRNHGFDPRAFIDGLPAQRVVQLHIAGHFVRPDQLIIDTHGEAVREEVYELLDYTLRRVGPVPVLLERDQNFPPFDQLVAEVKRIDAIYRAATEAPASAAISTPEPAKGAS